MHHAGAYAKYLYLRKIQEIPERATTNDHYSLVMAAGLLRHLLFEDCPLIHKANREFRLPIRFTVLKNPFPPLDFIPVYMLSRLNPHAVAPELRNITVVNEGALLKMVCLKIRNFSYTVHDVLAICAHSLGGIHHDDEPSEKERLFYTITRFSAFTPHTDNELSFVMREIITVVLDGIQPLTDAVTAELKAESREE